ncbi:MAG: C39 family peptidase [Patescibacteria group bacterium]|nr:C39 family peptidase [Patescibacteria group bacterium]
MSKKIKIYISLAILIILGFIFYFQRVKIKEFFTNSKSVDLPVEQSLNDLSSSGADLRIHDDNNDVPETTHKSSIEKSDNVTIPTNPHDTNIIKQEINLKIPFTIQSPDQKWDEKYKEGCEEASALMVYSYLKNKSITADSAMSDIGKMIDLQITEYGGQYNLSASTTAQLANQFFGIKYELVEIKSAQDIKRILSDGNPLILPTLGRKLQNPNFKIPGPIYHMLVVKGYTNDGIIITNDPGTRKGKDYTYNPDILFNAIGDWDYNIQAPNENKKIGIILK